MENKMALTKIKIFSSNDHKELENKVNKFINGKEIKKVKDIKLQQAGQYNSVSMVMVIYEEY